MKKIILILAIIFTASLNINAQKGENKSSNLNFENELKLNVLYVLLGNVEINYEHIINDYSGVGIMGNINVDGNEFMNMNYMFMPYYRLYFGEDADDLFFEGGFSFYNQNVQAFNGLNINQTAFGPSLSVGKKRVYENNIVLEGYFGLCRNYNKTFDGSAIFPRFGISIGKRF